MNHLAANGHSPNFLKRPTAAVDLSNNNFLANQLVAFLF